MADQQARAAIVTGASRGIGLAIAQALVERGDRVCLTGRNPEPLAEAVATLGAGNAVFVAGKAHDPAHQEEVVAKTLDAFGVPAQEKSEVLAAFSAHKSEVTEGSMAAAS